MSDIDDARIKETAGAVVDAINKRVPTQQHREVIWAKVTAIATGTHPTLTIAPNGDSANTIANVRYLGSYSPTVNDIVLCDWIGADIVCIGAIAPEGSSGGGTDLPIADTTRYTLTTKPNTYIGTGSIQVAEFSAETPAWAIMLTGDAYPRIVMMASPINSGLYLGDGTFDPLTRNPVLTQQAGVDGWTYFQGASITSGGGVGLESSAVGIGLANTDNAAGGITLQSNFMSFFGKTAGQAVSIQTITGALSAVADANVKAILTSLLAALAGNATTGLNLVVDGTT